VTTLGWLDCGVLSVSGAAGALTEALLNGVDPEVGPARTSAPTESGELLLMPASVGAFAGVKVVSVAPGNPALGLPRIHGVYLLFDGATLVPVALADGAQLTALRTPAVSLVAVTRLTPERSLRTVVFGTGPQAFHHVRGLVEVRPGSVISVVARSADKCRTFLDRCSALGIDVVPGQAADVADADLIICATTAERPLFDGTQPGQDSCVVAVGSHEPHVREVDRDYVARAALYVEARSAATAAGELSDVDVDDLVNLRELLTVPVDFDRPRLFKSVGMAWEDLVVAIALYRLARLDERG
jgi:ornithine cyclodeaminase